MISGEFDKVQPQPDHIFEEQEDHQLHCIYCGKIWPWELGGFPGPCEARRDETSEE